MANKTGQWQGKVYRPREVDYKLKTLPRSKVLKRDNYVCQSCRKRYKAGLLSIHHIIPRTEGGTNKMGNLITLCHHCHDLIELAEPPIRTKQEILYHAKALEDIELTERQLALQAEDDIDPTKAWRKWVYGGYRNPNNS